MKYKLFGAAWCQPCQMTKKLLTDKGMLFEHGSESAEGQVVEYVDIDKFREQAVENGIRGVPTIIDENGTRATGQVKIMELIKQNEHSSSN